MKLIVISLCVVTLAGCGVETATTAVTATAMKKHEIEQGKKTITEIQQKIDNVMQPANKSRTLGEKN